MSRQRNSPHAVVIGSGFGGLSAAVRLRAMGYRVSILEANEQPGGRASVFRQDGFTFDAGPTVITAPYLFDELFATVGRRAQDYFELMPVDPFYRVQFPDGNHFDYVGDVDRIVRQIREFSPDDVDGYLQMAEHARKIFETGYSKLAHVPFGRFSDMLRVAPKMIQLKNYRTVYGLVSQYIKDERLRQVFTFHSLLIGGNPFNVSSIYLLIHWLERRWGVHYARGGTGSIVKGIVQLLEELDVEIQLNTPVSEIEVSNGKAVAVRTESGARIECDIVVSNADPSFVYSRMIAAKHRKHNTDSKVARTKQSMGLFVAYFGTKKTYPDIAHHTILLGPRYKGLLNDIFERKVLAEDFSLYLHAPTRSDASVAPKGHECFYVLSPIPNTKGGQDWEKEHDGYFDRILDFLDNGCLPGLKENLVTKSAVDTRYFEGRLRSIDGAAFGPEPRLTQSAYFRYHNASPDVNGLYFVGAGTHPGAGVPGVLNSAKVLESVVPAVDHAERMQVTPHTDQHLYA